MSPATHTANGSPRCRAVIEDPGTGGTKQCSRSASHVLPDHPERCQWCGQHARTYDRRMTAAEKASYAR